MQLFPSPLCPWQNKMLRQPVAHIETFLKSAQRWPCRLHSSGLWYRVAWQIFTSYSKVIWSTFLGSVGKFAPEHSALLCLLMHIWKTSSKPTRVHCERLSDSPIARDRRGRTPLCLARCACTARARVYWLEISARSTHACTGWHRYATVANGFGCFGLNLILNYNKGKARFSEPSEKYLLTAQCHLQTRM
jgi:hypothetical protein